MPVKIIPAILAKDEQEFVAKLARVSGFAPMIHVDIMDGAFVPNVTWAPPDQVRRLIDKLPFEAHLMVSDPEHAVPVWLASGATRTIFHSESTGREQLICRATAELCPSLSMAINPDTPISRIIGDLENFRHVTIMGVPPGRGGQKFDPISLEKITALKQLRPGIVVSVDGGVKAENAAALVAAGADELVVGSAIMDAPDPESAYKEILAAAESGGKQAK